MFLATTVACLFAGCGEEDVPFVVDEDEIRRYLSETEEGRDLYRRSSLIADEPYSVPYDDEATYEDLVDSVRRAIYFDISGDKKLKDFGPYVTRDAEVEIEDNFHIRTVRTTADSTSEERRALKVRRYAYFLKLGSDAQAYSGWVLSGYNGGTPEYPANLTVIREDGASSFPGDGTDYDVFRYVTYDTSYVSNPQGGTDRIITPVAGFSSHRYVKLSEIENISGDSILVFRGTDIPNKSFYQLLCGETKSGFTQQRMARPDSATYLDTLRPPDPNRRLWNVVMLREFRRIFIPDGIPPDTMVVQESNWCVPYRVPQ
ncbi:MAG: hypothetical protein OEW00_01495 [candidate division Zixibacteria bacterium]|nr:hypothetical protein [candidate division Zixibacteria bacterium]